MSFINPLICREVLLSHGLNTREFKNVDHLNTYTQALQALDMDEWVELRAKLCSEEDVSEVLFMLDCYVHAYKAKKRADDDYNDYIDNRGPGHSSGIQYTRELQEHWAEMGRLRDECEEAFLLSDEIFGELSQLLA